MAHRRDPGGLDRLHHPDLDHWLIRHGRHPMTDNKQSIRTPLGRVRYLGSAHHGTRVFWHQRVHDSANVPLTIALIVILIGLMGRNHAAVVKILGSTLVAITMLLFIVTST